MDYCLPQGQLRVADEEAASLFFNNQIESSFDRYTSKVTNKNSTMKENLQLSLDPYESTFSTLPDLNYNLIPSTPTSLSEEIGEASERDLNENKEKENNPKLEKTDTEKHENTLSMVNDSLENTLQFYENILTQASEKNKFT